MTSGVNGSVVAKSGMFTITINGTSQAVDLGTLMMMLNLQRTETIDKQIAVQIEEMQDRNTMLKQYTELMSYCRKLKADGKDDNISQLADGTWIGPSLTIDGVTLPICVWPQTSGKDSWAGRLGIEWTNVEGERGGKKDKALESWNSQWDANINAIKGKIDILNNDSQVASIKLQNLLEKRNNAFEMASKVMDTNNQSVQSVLRNL